MNTDVFLSLLHLACNCEMYVICILLSFTAQFSKPLQSSHPTLNFNNSACKILPGFSCNTHFFMPLSIICNVKNISDFHTVTLDKSTAYKVVPV